MNDNKEIKLKRILYRSWHRGCKETDILLGDFAHAECQNLSPDELDIFESLLDENDWDIYHWVSGNHPAPAPYQDVIIPRIQQFQASRFSQ